MSLFLYLFFIPNKRSVGITHTKYYRTKIELESVIQTKKVFNKNLTEAQAWVW